MCIEIIGGIFEMFQQERSLPADNLERVGSIKYEEFFRTFLTQNQLCIFSRDLTKEWICRTEWVHNGKPNFEFLSRAFGDAVAPVADCSHSQFGSHVKQDMLVKDFLEYWRTRDPENQDAQTLYLKDWHFCKAFPTHKAYETPLYFKSDWLNEFWDQRSDVTDDFRFVYLGPKGSWTPFHADVLRSYSWSANICGCKKWLIYPPGQEEHLIDRLGNLPYDVTSDDMHDKSQYPNFGRAQEPITVVQREGEVIFVPSGWHHQVINLEDTISINHNWTNACGIVNMWEHLKRELCKVQHSIEDCKDMDNWDHQCQVILKASCGMNFEEFVIFLNTIADHRIPVIKGDYEKKQGMESNLECQSTVFEDWCKAMKSLQSQDSTALISYCQFDLQKIEQCISRFKEENKSLSINL